MMPQTSLASISNYFHTINGTCEGAIDRGTRGCRVVEAGCESVNGHPESWTVLE